MITMVWTQRKFTTAWTPAQQLREMQNEALRLLQVSPAPRARQSMPLSNLYSSSEELLLRAAVPGFGPEDIELEIEGRGLTLRGKHSERPFERSYSLPYRVDAEDVKAELANGLLEVRLPRAQADRPQRITIGSAE
jgi:HSP20 family protein